MNFSGDYVGKKLNVDCPICRSTSHSKHVADNGRTILKCRTCELLFFAEMPSNEALEDYYRVYAYGELNILDSITRISYDEVLNLLEKKMRGLTPKILDFGCGQGDFLKAARERGFDAHGMEFSESAVSRCRQAGLSCSLVKDFKQAKALLSAKSPYNIVTAFELIEHLPNPEDFLVFAQDILPDNGLLLLTTPNTKSLDNVWNYGLNVLAYPEHLCGFSSHTFRNVPSLTQMAIERIETRGSSLGLLRAIRRLLLRFNLIGDANKSNQGQVEVMPNIRVRRRMTTVGIFVVYGRYFLNLFFFFTGLGSTLRVVYRRLRSP